MKQSSPEPLGARPPPRLGQNLRIHPLNPLAGAERPSIACRRKRGTRLVRADTNRKNSREGPPASKALSLAKVTYQGSRHLWDGRSWRAFAASTRQWWRLILNSTRPTSHETLVESIAFWKASTRVWYGAYVASLNACWRFSETWPSGSGADKASKDK